jgi:hypothetical protein
MDRPRWASIRIRTRGEPIMDTQTVLSRLAAIRMDRRNVVRAAGIVAVTSPFTTGMLAAQEASPAASPHVAHGGDADVMPPEMRWTWTDEGADVPAEITAGWNHVVIENSRSMPVHVLTFTIPDDVTLEELQRDLFADESAPFPGWAREGYFPGLPDHVRPGAMLEGYTWYAEGRYVWVDLFSGVSGELLVGPGSWNRYVPAPDVHLGMIEMTFLGLDEPLAAGPQLWEVANAGATWHEVMVMRIAEPMTGDEVLNALMAIESFDDFPEGWADIGGYAITSPGSRGLVRLDLEPGAYAALCFAPDNFEGPPHAFMGMITTFTVD